MAETLRGADIVIRALEQQGVARVFTLSGNHIMTLFDAALGTRASTSCTCATRPRPCTWRMPGAGSRANPASPWSPAARATPMRSARCSRRSAPRVPMVLLSGHAGHLGARPRRLPGARPGGDGGARHQGFVDGPLGRHAGDDVGRAIDIARSGRPGPVHLSLPSDLLDEAVGGDLVSWPEPQAGSRSRPARGHRRCRAAALQRSGPPRDPRRARTCRAARVARCSPSSSRRRGFPRSCIESPRGVADATIGAFADVMRRADLVVLLGKALDFTVRWLEPPVADKSARVIVLDPDGALVARAAREKGERLLIGAVADSMPAARDAHRAGQAARASRPRLARGGARGHR